MAKRAGKRARKATPTTNNGTDGHSGSGEFSRSLCETIKILCGLVLCRKFDFRFLGLFYHMCVFMACT